MPDDDSPDLDAELDHFADRLPGPFKSWIRKLNDASPLLRVAGGVGLIAGGVLSFLPVLGVWMLPLGIVVLAKDIPPLRRPSARMLAWARSKLPPNKPASPDR